MLVGHKQPHLHPGDILESEIIATIVNGKVVILIEG